MPNRFVVNRAGMNRIVKTLGGPAAMCAAARGKSWAEANAPVRTGEYKRSFEVVPGPVGKDGRDGALLANTAGHAWAVEAGNGAKHTLRRAVDAIEHG